nr:hypothetical protein [Pseudomonas sp. BIGb0427]
MADSCIAAGHDCPAALLNIDTQKYTMAWLAFCQRPVARQRPRRLQERAFSRAFSSA